jgi:hypothetical protein
MISILLMLALGPGMRLDQLPTRRSSITTPAEVPRSDTEAVVAGAEGRDAVVISDAGGGVGAFVVGVSLATLAGTELEAVDGFVAAGDSDATEAVDL